MIAIRNRLFAVEEQIWLHEYAMARPGLIDSKVEPLSEKKYNQLLIARGEVRDECSYMPFELSDLIAVIFQLSIFFHLVARRISCDETAHRLI